MGRRREPGLDALLSLVPSTQFSICLVGRVFRRVPVPFLPPVLVPEHFRGEGCARRPSPSLVSVRTLPAGAAAQLGTWTRVRRLDRSCGGVWMMSGHRWRDGRSKAVRRRATTGMIGGRRAAIQDVNRPSSSISTSCTGGASLHLQRTRLKSCSEIGRAHV